MDMQTIYTNTPTTTFKFYRNAFVANKLYSPLHSKPNLFPLYRIQRTKLNNYLSVLNLNAGI